MSGIQPNDQFADDRWNERANHHLKILINNTPADLVGNTYAETLANIVDSAALRACLDDFSFEQRVGDETV